jgi:hypothetical protein
VAGVEGVAVALLTDFLFFFTCFLAAGAVLAEWLAAGAGVAAGAWAANAGARASDKPNTAEVNVFIFLWVPFREAGFSFCLCSYIRGRLLTTPERAIK